MLKLQVVLAFGVTVTGTSVLLYFIHKRRCKNCPPTEDWQYVGTLEEIMMYPIKSCAGIELTEAKCKIFGLECGELRDRIIILIDDDDYVGFAGRRPQMWKIKTRITADDELEVTAPNMKPLTLNISKMVKNRKEIFKCFEDIRIALVECDAEYGEWFSKFLLGKDSGIGLYVRLTPVPKRNLFGKSMELNPFMVITDESVADLNNRLTNEVHHWQFRGNFLINTHLPAFVEDNWKWMRIGNDAVFRYKAPCYRCILPNINPFTGERSVDFEPLRTLKRFRMKPKQKEPEMGIYFNLHREGVVKRGDPVYVVT